MFSQIHDHSLPKSLKGVVKHYLAESAAALLLQGRGVRTGCNYWLQVFLVVRDLLAIINWWRQFRQLYNNIWAESTLQIPKVEESQHQSNGPTWVNCKHPKLSQRHHHLLPIWLQRQHVFLPLSECCITLPAALQCHVALEQCWGDLIS